MRDTTLYTITVDVDLLSTHAEHGRATMHAALLLIALAVNHPFCNLDSTSRIQCNLLHQSAMRH